MSVLFFNIPNFIVIIFGGGISWWFYHEYKKTKSRALLNSLPGVFTSLGLLGTFFSICYSLHGLGQLPTVIDLADDPLANTRPSETQTIDIINLISKLIPAFTSSILGLFLALVANVIAKYIFSKEEKEENARLKNKSPEDYIRDTAVNTQVLSKQKDLLGELVSLLKAQEVKNREYNDRLNDNISHQSEILKEFIDGFVSRMDDIFQQMHGAIQHQVQTFGEEQFTKTSEVLTSITERLSSVSNDIINAQRQSVKTMMSNTNTEIGSITNALTEVIGKLTSEIQSSLTTLGKQQSERMSSIIANYDSLADHLSRQNTEFADKVSAQLKEEYENVQQHNVASLQQMIDLREAYQEATSDVMTKTLNMNETITDNLRESLTGIVSNIQESITTQCNALGTAISQNVESLNNAYQFIESLVAEIRQNYDQAVLAYGDAVNIAHRTNESSEKAIKATNKSLLSVEQTNQKLEKILNILTMRQDNIERLTKQISSVSNVIEQLQKFELALNRVVNK